MSNKKIFKYSLTVNSHHSIAMPVGAVILSVQTQNEIPCIWAEVDPEALKVHRCFIVYGTGQDLNTEFPEKYIGTFQVLGGELVFHLYERES